MAVVKDLPWDYWHMGSCIDEFYNYNDGKPWILFLRKMEEIPKHAANGNAGMTMRTPVIICDKDSFGPST